MVSTAQFAEVAALAGEPARAAMLQALSDGRALTASELARVAGITAQTASGHLRQLTTAQLLLVEKQGRHRYFRVASPAVARMLEAIMVVAGAHVAPRRIVVGPRDAAMRAARTCYDHFAGALGVGLADGMVARGHVELTSEGGLVTSGGMTFLAELGIDTAPLEARRARTSGRVLCRPCLDWSERRPHLAGMIGAALVTHSFQRGWTRRVEGSRVVTVTPAGKRAFGEKFGFRPA